MDMLMTVEGAVIEVFRSPQLLASGISQLCGRRIRENLPEDAVRQVISEFIIDGTLFPIHRKQAATVWKTASSSSSERILLGE